MSDPKVCERCGGTGLEKNSGLSDVIDKINAMPLRNGRPNPNRGKLCDRRCVRCAGTKGERAIVKEIDRGRVKARAAAFARAGIMMPSVAALGEAAAEQYGDDFEVYDGKRKFSSKEIS